MSTGATLEHFPRSMHLLVPERMFDCLVLLIAIAVVANMVAI
jgi:hypothetical protein